MAVKNTNQLAAIEEIIKMGGKSSDICDEIKRYNPDVEELMRKQIKEESDY